ncbi:recombinase RecA [Klebsiella pneumoniae]|uniref:recombinase RecA n=1 Tax=Klebsiella pneumoniae TaxID=573 RepID=UPI000D74618A|nr:recombinase RecA [Klebsiella pneumoniae]MDG0022425.1 recombinase RecA [Klebsiella pneumoniae]PXG86085.1 recombinase RecA [Klebsiella pneumoniae]
MEKADYISPVWEMPGKVHDWRNYAGNELISIWYTFSEEQKRAIALTLDAAASREEWD